MSWNTIKHLSLLIQKYGYHEYSFSKIPNEKMDKAHEIDVKLKWKYQTYHNTKTRARLKKNNTASFMYLRVGNQIIILKNKGNLPESITEKFHSFSDKLNLKIGDFTYVDIYVVNKKLYIRLSKQSYAYMKHKFDPLFPKKLAREIESLWQIIDKLPNFRGLAQQKQSILEYIKQNCKKHGIKLNEKVVKIKQQGRFYIKPLTQVPA